MKSLLIKIDRSLGLLKKTQIINSIESPPFLTRMFLPNVPALIRINR